MFRLKPLLLRELAWRIQFAAHGGLDHDTRRLLRAAIRNASVESSGPRHHAKKTSRIRQMLQLPTGAKLVRTWKGRKHEVTVTRSRETIQLPGSVVRQPQRDRREDHVR